MNVAHPRAVACLLGASTLGSIATIRAQDLTGVLTAYYHPQYAGVASHFHMTNTEHLGEALFDGEAWIFCSDVAARSLDEDGPSYPYTLTTSNSTLSLGGLEGLDVWARYATPRDQSLAIAQIHWLVDNYFESWFLTPSDNTSARRYAFQNMIWEIFGDGGTAAGLDFATGNIDRSKFGPGGSDSSSTLWSFMTTLADSVANSGVTESYDPLYNFSAALDSRSGYQDYLVLAADPVQMVPEPRIALLSAFGFILLLRRRDRH